MLLKKIDGYFPVYDHVNYPRKDNRRFIEAS